MTASRLTQSSRRPLLLAWTGGLSVPTRIAWLLIGLALVYSLAGSVLSLRVTVATGNAQPGVPLPAGEFENFVAFAREQVPLDGAYLFQEPWAAGRAHRLRYELYPRRYERLAVDASEEEVRAFVRSREIDFILVLDASTYPSDSWARQDSAWFDRVTLTPTSSILRVVER